MVIQPEGVNGTGSHAAKFIVVEANIGAGKTEFCHILKRVRREYTGPCEVLLEPVAKPAFRRLLKLFYEDAKRWGFTFQMFALKERFKQHTWASELAANGHSVVQDRSIFADRCFANTAFNIGNMVADEWEIYMDTFGAMKRFLRAPDIVIYLRVPPEVCKDRIDRRARAEEMVKDGISLDYLQRIHQEHETLIDDLSKMTRVLTVDWEHFGAEVERINEAVEKLCAEELRFHRNFRGL